jgi:hypothetical protein
MSSSFILAVSVVQRLCETVDSKGYIVHHTDYKLVWGNYGVIFVRRKLYKGKENYPFVTLHNTNLSLSLSLSQTHNFRENLDIPRENSLNNRRNYRTGPR